MLIGHFLALIPLLILLLFSMIFYGRGLIHILTLSYTVGLAYMAAGNSWEIIFLPILAITGLIAILLFSFAMSRGNWI